VEVKARADACLSNKNPRTTKIFRLFTRTRIIWHFVIQATTSNWDKKKKQNKMKAVSTSKILAGGIP
jgi:hypothetical protein